MARRAASFVSRFLAAPILICGSACAAPSPAGTEAVRSATGGVNHPAARDRPYVVLVSFDGFRADYLDRFDTPNFDALAARGAIAEGLVAVFPSMTFPGHYTIATGMHPEAHGIVGNRFHDPVRGETFDYRDREQVEDGSWWGGEPIWVTAETQGLVAAAMFFPGAEAAVGGVRPTHWRRYDRGLSNLARVETVIEWLTLPPANRPHLVTLYFSLVDGAGHALGPDAPGMRRSVEAADRLLGRLLDGVDALPHAERIGLIVVSDHGMAAPDPARLTVLPEIAELAGVRRIAAGPSILLYVGGPERSRALRDALNERLTHARAYLREELPAALHARGSARMGDVVVVPDGAGFVRMRGAAPPLAGMHGWDPRMPEMRGIFLAAGPGIAKGITLPPVEAIHVYPLVAHLLGLEPNPGIAGDLAAFAPALRTSPPPAR